MAQITTAVFLYLVCLTGMYRKPPAYQHNKIIGPVWWNIKFF